MTDVTKKLLARFKRVADSRTTAQEEWDLIRRFVYPIGGGKFWEPQASEHEMTWREREVYDDTAIIGVDTLASSLHSALTPPSSQWFDAKFRLQELQDDTEAVEWLRICMGLVWDEIQDSNFDLEIAEFYLDIASFGNAAIASEVKSDLDWDGVHFTALPLKECYFEMDHKGNVSHFYRHRQWLPQEIVSRFPDTTPEKIREAAERGDQTRVGIVFALAPNPTEHKASSGGTSVDKRPVQGYYLLEETAEQLGDTVGYYEMPACFGRWRRAAGSVWGYGPGHLALPSVLTVNQLKRIILQAAEKVIDPAILTTERGVIGDIDLAPSGVTVVRDTAAMIPFESRARVDVSQLEVDKLQQSIRDLFRMNQLELQQGPQMTATEVEVRYELMHRLFGPAISRLRIDVLNKFIHRIFSALARAGKLPPPPESVNSLPSDIDLHYLGPLARAQKMDKVNNIQRWATTAAELGQSIPQSIHAVKGDAVVRMLAREMNIPEVLTRDQEETDYVLELEQTIEQMAQQMEQLAAQEEGEDEGAEPQQ